MINNYNSLVSGSITWLKKKMGIVGSSPPVFQSKATSNSWLLSLFVLMALAMGQQSWAQTTLIDPAGDGGFESTFGRDGGHGHYDRVKGHFAACPKEFIIKNFKRNYISIII